MALSDIVNVQITRASRSISQAGFGIPLILGLHTRFAELVREYTSAKGLLDDGFLTSDAEYQAAVAAFAQEKKPRKILVGKRSAVVAQVVTITPTAVNNFTYSVTINGVVHTFLSDASATATEIVTGLIAAINGGSEAALVTATGTTTLIITADNAGEGFSYAVGANLAAVLTTPNNGIVEDLVALSNVNNDWYALVPTSQTLPDIRAAAAYIETLRRIMICQSNDSAIKTSSTSDLGSYLKAKNYFRTALIWSGIATEYVSAAWAGRVLPDAPGTETWKFKNLSGVTPDKLTATEQTNLNNKNVNHYQTVGGLAITQEGKMAGGEFIDVIRLIDFIQARIEEGIYGDLVAVEKIPFTDGGGVVLESRIRSVLQQSLNQGGLASFDVQVPKVADIPQPDRAARLFSGITFDAVLAGAIHATEINGFVTV